MQNKYLYLTRDESQKLDREAIETFAIPSIVLMENAGRSAVDVFLNYYTSGKVVICCGKGNNAGDGFVVARHLNNQNIPVSVLLFASPHTLTIDASINYRIAVNSGITVDFCSIEEESFTKKIANQLAHMAWIIDAIFGTGLIGEVKAPYDKIIQTINMSNVNVLSLDIPSGLDCDTGKPLGTAIKAHHTVTFAAMKKGFKNPEAQLFLGNVHIVDIGIPRRLLDQYNKLDST